MSKSKETILDECFPDLIEYPHYDMDVFQKSVALDGCILEMCRKYKVSYMSVHRNMKKGLSFKEAVKYLRLKNYGNKHQSQQP